MSALIPSALSSISPYIKLSKEFSKRDDVISYYCLIFAAEKGLKIGCKAKEVSTYLMKLFDELEKQKLKLQQGERSEIFASNELVRTHAENFINTIFEYADNRDRQLKYDMSVIQAFYKASLLYDVLSMLGPLSDDDIQKREYSKWRSTYLHKCLQNGETPEGPKTEMSSQPSEEQLVNVKPKEDKKPIAQSSNSDQCVLPPQQITHFGLEVNDPRLSTKQAFDDISTATKYCNYAISSLQFARVDEATKHLQQAMDTIKKYL